MVLRALLFNISVFGSTIKEVMFKDGNGSVELIKMDSVLLLAFNPYSSISFYIVSVVTYPGETGKGEEKKKRNKTKAKRHLNPYIRTRWLAESIRLQDIAYPSNFGRENSHSSTAFDLKPC